MLKSKGDITNMKLIDFGLSKDYSGQPVMCTPSGSVIYTNFSKFILALLHCSRSVLIIIYLKNRLMVNGCCALYFTFG